MGLRKRLTQTMEEVEHERLQTRFADLGLPSLADMPCRKRVQVVGEIRVERIRPRSGIPSYEVVVADGTGEVVAVFTGRGDPRRRGAPGTRAPSHAQSGLHLVARTELLSPPFRRTPHSGHEDRLDFFFGRVVSENEDFVAGAQREVVAR